MALKTLIFIPTFNERENAPAMLREIDQLGLDSDILFIDDGSPDGTGMVLDELRLEYPRLAVRHRAGKLGIGSAHQEAIQWASDQGYAVLVTLDCDFTHSPSDIPYLIEATNEADVAIGSRWLAKDSLPGWNVFRRGMTRLGHLLTRSLLRLPHDATGAFRVYRLDRVEREVFSLIKSQGYAFFFESLFVLRACGATIAEIPIILPARTYGSSKMTTRSAWHSLQVLFLLSLTNFCHPERFRLSVREIAIDDSLSKPQDWDAYWEEKKFPSAIAYELIAAIYRNTFIRRRLNRVIGENFQPGARLLHGGCGCGQVDGDIQEEMQITAVDISTAALALYQRNNPQAIAVFHASIFNLSSAGESFDGYYNLGVLEHFTKDEIRRILSEAFRVLRSGGKLVVFWPHAHAPSVYVLDFWHGVLRLMGLSQRLHPPEISLLKSRAETPGLFTDAGFKISSFQFGPADLWIQAVIVAEKG